MELTPLLTLGLVTATSLFSSLGTLVVQWMRRDKTEAEADVKTAQAEKIQTDVVIALYQTIAETVKDIQSQAQKTIEYIITLDTCKRDILRLESENQKRATQSSEQVLQIKRLKNQVAGLLKAKTALTAQVAELIKSGIDKDGEIEKMQRRINVLEAERTKLNERLNEAEKDSHGIEETTEEAH